MKRNLQNILRKSKSCLGGKGWTNPLVKQLLASSTPTLEKKSLFNFTVDFELVWSNAASGTGDLPLPKRLEWARRQVENFAPFLELINAYQFPVTFAVACRMLEFDASIDEDKKFAPSWSSGDWYQGGNPELSCGRSMVQQLVANPHIEVISHGYAHISYQDKATTTTVAEFDMRRSRELLASLGCETSGFVYPCNGVAHYSLLAPNGYRVCRGMDQDWHHRDGVFFTPRGFWLSPGVLSASDLTSYLKEASQRGYWIHPWMHLIEAETKQKDLENFYKPMFERVLELQEKGELELVRFRDLPGRVLSFC